MMKKYCCFIFLMMMIVAGSSDSSNAQIPEKLYFENFTVEDGLPGNFIRDITQDSLGFMWFASEGGIARYDGYEFEIFRNIPGDKTSISDDDVNNLVTDKYGNIWVNTFIGIDKYDPLSNRFTRYFQDPTDSTYLEPGIVGVIVPTKVSGDIWIGTADEGLVHYDPFSGEFNKYESIISKEDTLQISFIEDITEDNDGNVWISAGKAGLIKYDLAADSLIKYLFSEDPPSFIKTYSSPRRRLFVDDENILWVDYSSFRTWEYENIKTGDETGLWQLNLETGEHKLLTYDPVKQPFTGPFFFPIVDNDIFWFARPFPLSGKIGLHAYSKTDNDYRHIQLNANDPNSLISNEVNVIYIDTFGSLWAGTTLGLSKADISRKQLEAFSPDPIQLISDDNNFSGIIEVRPDVFWISRVNKDPIEWNRETGEWKAFKLPFSSMAQTGNNTFQIGKRSGDLIWFSEPPRIQMGSYNLKTGGEKSYPLPKESADTTGIIDFKINDSGIVWINNINGLNKLDPVTKSYTQYNLTSPFIKDTIAVTYTAFTEDDKIWCMTIDEPLDSARQTFGILLHKFDPETGVFSPVAVDQNYLDALNHGFASGIMTDSKGDVWIAKSNGLVHYDVSEENFTWYNEDDGLADLFVLEVAEDNSGMIWLTTSYGVSMFDPERKIFRNFERSDGLRPVRIQGESMIQKDNGEFIIIGYGGLNVIDPDDIEEYGTAPNVIITDLDVDGKRLVTDAAFSDTDRISLPWNLSGLEVAYSAVNFRSADKTTYSYKMDGLNEDFLDVGNRRYAQFTNLEPGDYTFRVRATNAEGISSENDTVLAISILPPWWRTWWAYGMYALIFAGGVFTVDRVQRRRVLYKEKERAREKELQQAKKIEEAYKELEKSHKNLQAAQEQLVQQEKLASLGQLTAGIAHEIKNPLNFVNNFSDLSAELINEVRDEITSVTKTHKLESPVMKEIYDILDDVERNLKKIHEHGTRADSIVKSMLQHSRGGSGSMEPTDLNELIEEYANLAFHGMRAGKDPITVDIDLDLDGSIGEIPLIAEDLSRAILNLCNNAFDALREKKNSEEYSPRLSIRSFVSDKNCVVLEIEDNGLGIPDEIKDKIMQPFFTTKKGTQGTGLGLSITNDIIKAHGGFMSVDTGEGFTRFRIELTK